MSISRYRGEPRDIVVDFPADPVANALPGVETIATRTDVSMNLKRVPAFDADDAYLELTETGGGVTVDEAQFVFTMDIASGSYPDLIPGEYQLVIAVKVPSETKWLELCVTDPVVYVTPAAQRV